MRTSHFFIATLGTLSLHVMIAYVLFMGSQMILKPAVQELSVTQVSFLDEPPFVPQAEEMKQQLPPMPDPVVEKKPEKKVKKEPVKTVTPLQPPMKETMSASSAVTEPLVEPAMETPTSSKAHEKASAASSHQSDDLLLVYLAKVRRKIQESLHYPSMAKKMGLEGEAVVQFLIHSNGMVDASSVKIAKSSGKALLDRNAIDAVLEAVPFELPPKEELEISIPVVFKIKS